MNRSLFAVPLLIAALSFSGCATTGATDALQTQLDSCGAELESCKSSLAKAQGDLKKARAVSEAMERRMKAYKELADAFREAFGDEDLTVILRNGRMVVQLPNRVLFDSGKTELKAEGKAALDKLAPVIEKAKKRHFLIAGHTDNVSVKSNPRFRNNWELSTLRGVVVVEYLVGKGIAPTRLGAAGYGEFLPEASNDTDEGKATNRRTEVIVLPLVDEIPTLNGEL